MNANPSPPSSWRLLRDLAVWGFACVALLIVLEPSFLTRVQESPGRSLNLLIGWGALAYCVTWLHAWHKLAPPEQATPARFAPLLGGLAIGATFGILYAFQFDGLSWPICGALGAVIGGGVACAIPWLGRARKDAICGACFGIMVVVGALLAALWRHGPRFRDTNELAMDFVVAAIACSFAGAVSGVYVLKTLRFRKEYRRSQGQEK